MPIAVGKRADEDVRDDGLARAHAIFQPGLRIEPLHLLNHVAEVFVRYGADALQLGEIMGAEKIEMLDQGGHGRIVAIALLQL